MTDKDKGPYRVVKESDPGTPPYAVMLDGAHVYGGDRVFAEDICRQLNAAHAAGVAQERAKHEWRPIETAPNKKTILMFAITSINPPNWRMATGYVFPDGIEWNGWRLAEYDHKPTHWMPLPEPPAIRTPSDGEKR